MNIYVARDGQTYGPYTAEHAHQMIGQGQLQAADLACAEGAADWVPLGQVSRTAPHPAGRASATDAGARTSAATLGRATGDPDRATRLGGDPSGLRAPDRTRRRGGHRPDGRRRRSELGRRADGPTPTAQKNV